MSNEMKAQWGTILLVGGSGRLGYFLSKELFKQPECRRVVSISRSAKIAHPHDGVEYRVADVTDSAALEKVITDVRPQIIFNAAAPSHTNTLTPRSVFDEVFVEGQDTLMRLAKDNGAKYMICTTSANVIEGDGHVRDLEAAPYWPDDSSGFAYWVERARGERRLLAMDSPTFQTLSLRLPLIIGEREYAFVPGLLKTLKDGGTSVQVGNDRGLMDVVSGDDAARAHILALRALMEADNNVHGEAFNVIGKYPLSFWTMARIVWKEAGWQEEKPRVVIPNTLAWVIARISDLAMRPFGMEPQLSVHVYNFMVNSWTYDDSKARERLNYVAKDDTEEELRKSVVWWLKNGDA